MWGGGGEAGEGGKGVTCSSFVHFLMEYLRVGFNVCSQMHVNSIHKTCWYLSSCTSYLTTMVGAMILLGRCGMLGVGEVFVFVGEGGG